jgi:hypothetical protein
MAYDANGLKKQKNKQFLILTDAVKKLIFCAEDIQEISKSFVYASNKVNDTCRIDYEKNPYITTNELKALMAQYNFAAERLKVSSRDILDGNTSEKVLSEIIIYGIFLQEQNDLLRKKRGNVNDSVKLDSEKKKEYSCSNLIGESK